MWLIKCQKIQLLIKELAGMLNMRRIVHVDLFMEKFWRRLNEEVYFPHECFSDYKRVERNVPGEKYRGK